VRHPGAARRFALIQGLHRKGPRIPVVDLLIPELQRRGRFRTAYTGRTLRENLAG
jgi:hypothetical protein